MTLDSSDRPHVLIVGAGPGGLTLAQILRAQGVSFEIFDRDENATSRTQGWALALHTFLPDLKALISPDMPSIETVSHFWPLQVSSEFCMYGGGRRFGVEASEQSPAIRANRQRLRNWLTTNIDIKWNHKLEKVAEEGEKVKVTFADGSTATGDILVGAEGVKSKVRHYLLGDQDNLQVVPVAVLIGELIVDKEQFERQLKLGHSANAYMGHGFHIFNGLSEVLDNGNRAKYYWMFIWDDPKATEGENYWTSKASKQELLDFVVEKTKDVEEDFAKLIRITKPEGMVWPTLVFRDFVAESMPNRNITLLGDAIHPMAPFRGQGGSQAMMDAVKLGQVLCRTSKADIRPNLKEYQEEMLARTGKIVKASRSTEEVDISKINAWGQQMREYKN